MQGFKFGLALLIGRWCGLDSSMDVASPRGRADKIRPLTFQVPQTTGNRQVRDYFRKYKEGQCTRSDTKFNNLSREGAIARVRENGIGEREEYITSSVHR